jgi:hypothetical protein
LRKKANKMKQREASCIVEAARLIVAPRVPAKISPEGPIQVLLLCWRNAKHAKPTLATKMDNLAAPAFSEGLQRKHA